MILRGDNMSTVKRGNRSAILNLLHSRGETSRKRLAEQMKITPAAITLITGEMIMEGLILEGNVQRTEKHSGRREIPLKIAYHNFFALGVAFGMNEDIVSATRLDGTLIGSERVPADLGLDVVTRVAGLSHKLSDLADAHGIDRERIVGLGITVRGSVNVEKTHSVHSHGMFDERDIPLVRLFQSGTGFFTSMDNDARAMFRAHIFCTGQVESSDLFICCENGIGGAISADGYLLTGNRGKCAALGHTPVVEEGGKPCFCGKTGCLETVATPAALLADVSAIYSETRTPRLYSFTRGHVENLNLDLIFRAAQGGDLEVDGIVQNAVKKLGAVIKPIAYALDPSGVLLYGQIFEHDYFLDSLHQCFADCIEVDPVHFVRKSSLNLTLDDKAACIIAAEAFFAGGGYIV